MQKTEAAQSTIDEVLERIIDEWYDKVAAFYITSEQLQDNPDLGGEELKRFHDAKGHRIKFAKDDLDVTYGLRSFWRGSDLLIEVSVNNKVPRFDYGGFKRKLEVHYETTGKKLVPTPYELRSFGYNQVFELESNFSDAFKVEIREDKADIMGLSFRLNPSCLDKLIAHPVSGRVLIEGYCVTPFRNIYATVYRRSS